MAKRAKKAAKKAKKRAAKIVLPIPQGFHTLTPSLVVRDAPKAMEFYKQAFGAAVKGVHYTPDGKVMHATLKIGDSPFMLGDEFPSMNSLSPQSRGGTSVTIHIYCKDVDAAFNRAVSAGAKVLMPVTDMFWGDRYGQVEDSSGHRWSLAAHKEDLSSKEVEERGKAIFAQMAKSAGQGS